MFTLSLWIGIAILGLVLYVAPAFFVRHMYEGFEKQDTTKEKEKEEEEKEEKEEEKEKETKETKKTKETKETKETKKETEKDKEKKSENDSSTVSDLKSMLKKLEKLMEPQIKTPDTDTPPPSSSDKVKASGLTKQPEYHDSVKSQPGTAKSYTSDNTCLEQGKNYKSLYPSDTTYEKRIKQHCPPAVQCPDMRDYIRKDSIPCWACKLK